MTVFVFFVLGSMIGVSLKNTNKNIAQQSGGLCPITKQI